MTTTVYLIEGWFGDQEWVEGIYADEAKANEVIKELWETRRSTHWPEDHWIQQHCKFAVIPHEVIE